MSPSRKTNGTTEQEAYDFLLAQRILADLGALDSDDRAVLDERIPDWYTPVSGPELARALTSDDIDLNEAFELWWNTVGLSKTPMTFAEIKAKAAAEM